MDHEQIAKYVLSSQNSLIYDNNIKRNTQEKNIKGKVLTMGFE
jgi:hypothetical protein